MENNFCPLPFIAIERKSDGWFTPCCLNTKFVHANLSTIEQYQNSAELRDLQISFNQNLKDQSCSACWKLEEQGIISQRLLTLSEIINCSSGKIQKVKIYTGSECNISCMYCFPNVSSTFRNLWKNTNKLSIPINHGKKTVLTYDIEMDNYIRNNLDQIKYITALGGEPMMSKKFINLIDYLIQTQAAAAIEMYIVTNGTVISRETIKKLSKFKKIALSVSIDAVGLANDYIRWPSKFQDIEKNLGLIKATVRCNIIPTISALNIARLPELYEYCDKKNISVGAPNVIQHWTELFPENIPDKLKKSVDKKFLEFINKNGSPDKLLNLIRLWDSQRNIYIGDFMNEWKEFV